MNREEAFRLSSAKYQGILHDPFPEITEWERRSNILGLWKVTPKPKPEVNPHEAWKMGFDFAFELIDKRIAELEGHGHAK